MRWTQQRGPYERSWIGGRGVTRRTHPSPLLDLTRTPYWKIPVRLPLPSKSPLPTETLIRPSCSVFPSPLPLFTDAWLLGPALRQHHMTSRVGRYSTCSLSSSARESPVASMVFLLFSF